MGGKIGIFNNNYPADGFFTMIKKGSGENWDFNNKITIYYPAVVHGLP